MKVLAGNANKPLAEKVANYLNLELTNASIKRFSDMEIFVEIEENVRGEDMFVIQPTSYPANDNLMELLVTLDALKRASADRITAVVPYYGYARQDRKTAPRTPITAKLIANLITHAGANRVLTVDLHSGQIQGFFDIPLDNLYSQPVFAEDITKQFKSRKLPTIVSPDVGGVLRARAIAKRLGTDLAIIDKRRDRPGESEVMNIIGEIKGKDCLFIDDIIDSAGTISNAAGALIHGGAKSVSAYVTHGVLSGEALIKIAKSPLKELVITDSIEATNLIIQERKIRQISIAPLIAEAVMRISSEASVSSLFD